MIDEQLLDRLGNAEDRFVERKQDSVRRGELRQTLVAFANSVPEDCEAVLFIGVADDGKITGVTDPDKRQKDVRKAAEECYPPIDMNARVIKIGEKQVVAVTIGTSDNRPHFAGPAYVRVGSENKKASADLYEQLIASRNTKAGAILRQKGSLVTVIARKKLGSTKRLGDKMYRATHECRVEDCDAHVVHLYDLKERTPACEPLEKVTIGYDPQRSRMLLDIME